MSKGISLRQGRQQPGIEGYYSFTNAEPGPKSVVVEVSPGVDRQHYTNYPATLCDRVKIVVGQSVSRDPADSRDCLISTFEMPVTEPPRTVEEIAALAQGLADLTVGHADQVFALYS